MDTSARRSGPSDGRQAELTEAVGRRMESLLGDSAREMPKPQCAKAEVILELMVCQSQIPLPRIAEVLGLQYPGDFGYWCECVTGLPPQVLRELGSRRPTDVRPALERPAQTPAAQPAPAAKARPAEERPSEVSSGSFFAAPVTSTSADDELAPSPRAPSPATWCRLLTLPKDRMRPADRAALEWLEAKRTAAAPRRSRHRRPGARED